MWHPPTALISQLYWNMNGSIPKNIPTGDDYVKFGEAPWISEMYGYMFAAAEQARRRPNLA
jgi:hypothetical protein|eukprot:2346607-Prymnesium_polylepis.3